METYNSNIELQGPEGICRSCTCGLIDLPIYCSQCFYSKCMLVHGFVRRWSIPKICNCKNDGSAFGIGGTVGYPFFIQSNMHCMTTLATCLKSKSHQILLVQQSYISLVITTFQFKLSLFHVMTLLVLLTGDFSYCYQPLVCAYRYIHIQHIHHTHVIAHVHTSLIRHLPWHERYSWWWGPFISLIYCSPTLTLGEGGGKKRKKKTCPKVGGWWNHIHPYPNYIILFSGDVPKLFNVPCWEKYWPPQNGVAKGGQRWPKMACQSNPGLKTVMAR